ncbi:hypothetical protein LCGC14_1398500 [marine sediment metagenome]|uniref:Uncharacterized protein n=1 Tax=marine sediment metagenome TaxID=412755 RepID=A0A0F9JXU4_9ZZZZ|nr:hypothetical protein [Desulfobacterales bacterium]
MPDKICEVQCPVVDKKLELVWGGINERVTLKVFKWVVGGIGFIAIFLMGMIFANQSSMAKTLSNIQSNQMVIQSELKHLNGKGDRR